MSHATTEQIPHIPRTITPAINNKKRRVRSTTSPANTNGGTRKKTEGILSNDSPTTENTLPTIEYMYNMSLANACDFFSVARNHNTAMKIPWICTAVRIYVVKETMNV